MAGRTLDLPTILETHCFISRYVQRTPLVRSAYLSERSGAEVWLKLENQQPTGSFKVRGALSKIGTRDILLEMTGDQRPFLLRTQRPRLRTGLRAGWATGDNRPLSKDHG